MKRFRLGTTRASGSRRVAVLWRVAGATAVILALAGGSVVFAATHSAGFATGLTNAPGWVGTWASSQVEPGTSGQSSTGFDDQTVRNIIHTSVGGSELRLRISNVFGTQPLVVNAVDVGIQSSGAGVQPGTNTEATFDGSDSVTIQPGAEALSDPVRLTVSNEQNLAVSLFFQGSTGPATWHPSAIGTNYFASGDAASDTTGDPYTNTDSSWYFLDGVDVLNPSVKGAVVAFGASVTDGTASTSNANERYTDDLARRLLQLPAGQRLSVLDAGISGDDLLTDVGTSGAAGVARFLRDAVQQDGVRDVIVWLGTNDIGNKNPSLNPSQMTSAYQELIDIGHENGIKVIGATLQPDEGNGEFSPQGNVTREGVNSWILASGAFDGALDFSTALQDPANTAELRPAYDSGDHLHPNDVGYQVVADSVNLETLTAPGRVQVFQGTATPSALSATVGTDASTTESVTLQSLSDRTYTLPWKLSAPAGSGITVSPSSGRVTIPAGGTATVSFAVHTGSTEGSSSLALNLFDPNGESALASHFTVVVDKPGDLAPLYNNTGISDDSDPSAADLDGGGFSYSEELLTAAGLAPGATVTAGGQTFTWPDVPAGQPDNIEAQGQTIVPDVTAGAGEIGFLGTGANSGTTGSEGEATINYTDGTSTTDQLGFGGYALGFAANPVVPFGDTIVATLPSQNSASGTPRQSNMYLFEQNLAVDPAKTVASVVLPASAGTGQIHVFAVS